MPDLLRAIDEEVRAGLRNEAMRLDDALYNLECHRAYFSLFPPRASGGVPASSRLERTSPIMRRVVQTLTANLYSKGPARILKAPENGGSNQGAYDAASEWLNAIYRAN